jgi:hypothetical protein
VIGGLIAATFMTLLVIPIVYSFVGGTRISKLQQKLVKQQCYGSLGKISWRPCTNDHPVSGFVMAEESSPYVVQMLRAAIRNWSRNHACAGSVVSRECHAMK